MRSSFDVDSVEDFLDAGPEAAMMLVRWSQERQENRTKVVHNCIFLVD